MFTIARLKFFVFLMLAAASASLWQVRSNALYTQKASAFLRDYYAPISPAELAELEAAETEVRRRFTIYNAAISESFLDLGMVVSRNHDGRAIDLCDSLLFSSLRYVSLVKMGLGAQADEAWRAIANSQNDGKWLRHPSCTTSTSRDMIIGVMAALTQRPPGYREHFLALLRYLGTHQGYVGDGPFYVSYLSPGLAEILRHFARIERIPDDELPSVVRYGFSTMELDTYVSGIGFESHLLAMVVWIELELSRLEARSGLDAEYVRALPIPLERVTRALWGVKVLGQRLPWLAQRLVDRDPANLYFRYLRIETAGALTNKSRLALLRELLEMKQFPQDRLPSSCDRRADYLWQRASREYRPKVRSCDKQFPGVDFLWMTALLAPVISNHGMHSGLAADGELTSSPKVH